MVGAMAVRGEDVTFAAIEAIYHFLYHMLREAIAKRELAQEMLDRYREINLLYRVGERIGKQLDANTIPALLLDEAAHVIQYDCGIVLNGQTLEIQEARGAKTLIDTMLDVGASFIQQQYERQRSDMCYMPIMLCVPISSNERIHGMMILGRGVDGQHFTAGDEKLLLALAHQAAIALQTSELHEEQLQMQLLEQELAVGQDIQRSLLPQDCPQLDGWQFTATYEAARQVGGDFYDFVYLPQNPDLLGVMVADVTGKGVPAAIFMALSRAVMRTIARTTVSPAQVLTESNATLLDDNHARVFLTAFYLVLNTKTGDLFFSNAGHDYPILHTDGHSRYIEADGFVLGAFRNITLDDQHVQLEHGDVFVLYTDGLTEARNINRELYETDRLRQMIEANAHLSAQQIQTAIVEDLKVFVGKQAQSDDMTLVVIKRT